MSEQLLPGPRGPLDGTVRVPPSKSLTNRGLIVAAAAGGGTLHAPLDCTDTRLLAGALARCGWQVEWTERLRVGARRPPAGTVHVDLGNSGTGARFLLTLLAVLPGDTVVDGSPRLRQRPMAPLVDALQRLGADVEAVDGRLPVRVRGRSLAGGRITLAPGVSSQFASALVLAAPAMERGLELELVGEVPSRPYIALTLQVLEAFGGRAEVDVAGRLLRVAPGGLGQTELTIEGDWSAAAFFLAAAAVAGGRVAVEGVATASLQGDRAALEILRPAVPEVAVAPAAVTLTGPLGAPVAADLTDTPDLFPALAVAAAAAPPGSRLSGLQHLRHKESDRLAVMLGHLRALGAIIETADDGRTLVVREPFPAGRLAAPMRLAAADDHRIAMALAVASLRRGPLMVDDKTAVDKSFPGFWSAWEAVVG